MRPATLSDEAPGYEPLALELDVITMRELKEVVKAFRPNKAAGPDGHPVEFWKAVLDNAESPIDGGAAWLFEFGNAVWCQARVPDAWHLQRVAVIFKKGDPSDCGNYRPICLLNAAYKIFAMLLLKRLVLAGADERIWPTQFGFKRQRGTDEALHCARRAVERAWADRGGKLHLLDLDWRKAFDSINPDALLNALRRFGLPPKFVDMVSAIYTNRVFEVSECGATSSRNVQNAGICQGCPLSPYLFIIVMTVLMHDARGLLDEDALTAISDGRLYDISMPMTHCFWGHPLRILKSLLWL